jgi:O-antigen/teichoic acid export membrane protein
MRMRENIVGVAALNASRVGFGMLSSIATTAIIARALGPTEMGSYVFAIWVVTSAVTLANLAFPITATKFIAHLLAAGNREGVRRLLMTLGGTQFAAAVLAAALAGVYVLRSISSVTVFWLVGALILVQAAQEFATAALLGMQLFQRTTQLSAASSVIRIVCIIAAALFWRNVSGFLLALAVSNLLALLLTIGVGSRGMESRTTPKVITDTTSEMRLGFSGFSLIAGYSVLLNLIVWQRSEIVILEHFHMTEQIAFYSAAFSIAGLLRTATTVFSDGLLPSAAAAFGRSDHSALHDIYRRGTILVAAVAAPLCLSMAIMSRFVIHLVFSDRFEAATPLLFLITVVTLVTSMGAMGWVMTYATGRQSYDAIAGTVVAALDICLALALVPRLGAMGAAIAGSVAQLVATVAGIIYINRTLALQFPFIAIGRFTGMAALCLVPAAVTHFTGHENAAAACTVIGLLVYGLLVGNRYSGELSATVRSMRGAGSTG